MTTPKPFVDFTVNDVVGRITAKFSPDTEHRLHQRIAVSTASINSIELCGFTIILRTQTIQYEIQRREDDEDGRRAFERCYEEALDAWTKGAVR